MPLKWPSLPLIVAKALSLVLFSTALAFKVVDLTVLYSQFESHCIAGWEITDKVSVHMILITMSLVPDVAFILCIGGAMFLKLCNFGADPGTIVYNFIVGACCISSILPIKFIENCGNDAIPIVKSVYVYSLIAGVVHLINGAGCLLFLMPEERTIPARRPLSSRTSLASLAHVSS